MSVQQKEHSALPLFILAGRKILPRESRSTHAEMYDVKLQLWVDRDSGEPLVNKMRAKAEHSKFGETQMTETREGADQSEVSGVQASQFGETTVTKTMEGADQTEVTCFSRSEFGETSITRTHEGHDQTEIVCEI